MGTYRQHISNIRSANRILSSDAQLTDRGIMQQLRLNAIYLVKQKVDQRLLYRSPNIFTYVPCLEMINVPLAECCEYRSEKTIARSKMRLPGIAEGKFGLLVQKVTGLEFATTYNEATPTRYVNLLTINPKTKKDYYWVLNDFLYVTNEDAKRVSISAYFEEEPSNSILCPDDCDCGPVNDCDPCQNPLDRELKCPFDLLGTVESMVSKYLLETYFNVKTDTSSDQKDQQAKNEN